MSKRHGTCLCGRVTIKIDKAVTDVGVCHCSMCRTWSTGPMHAIHVGPNADIQGSEHIGRYRSSDWAERAFCKSCGTNLFYQLLESNEYIVNAGLFSDTQNFEIKNQIFIDEKPDYYALANDTPTMTGAEVFALYAPKDD